MELNMLKENCSRCSGVMKLAVKKLVDFELGVILFFSLQNTAKV